MWEEVTTIAFTRPPNSFLKKIHLKPHHSAETKTKPPKPKIHRDTTPVTTDPQFSIIHNDPRFTPPKRRDTSLTIDSRFRSVLRDPKFSSKASRIDRYGRKPSQESSKAELPRFYKLASDDEEEETEGWGCAF